MNMYLRWQVRILQYTYISIPSNLNMAYLQASYADLEARLALLSDAPPHPLLDAFQSNTSAFGAWIYLPGSIIARTVA